ncbi:potassium/proton antiporter [Sporichthya sp.]|uniref:potassium/proton antiporter n=1 Tax=Sporichthya sp. TaxID=65475 RepID=UPI00182E6225|nr:potassium/proton antiporter [Sporichthya sp.]MBA3743385.1 potassium/proton antiporter [Sporichthya sp.]
MVILGAGGGGEGSITVDDLDQALLMGSLVLLVAVVAVRVASRTALPSLLLYLGLGVVLGQDVIGIEFDDAELTRTLGYAALVIILAEGGLTTNWATIRPSVPAAAMLATVGVGVSVMITGAAAHYLLDLPWQVSFLLAAIVSSTDAAAVFSVLRLLSVRPRLVGILEAESGFNDAPIVVLAVALSTTEAFGAADFGELMALLVYELAVGLVIGLAAGYLGANGLRRIALPSSGLYPIAVLALALFAYSGAAAVHASGFLAVYVAALVLGNSRLPHRPATRSFVEGLAWLAQIGLFVLLGLLVTPSELGSDVMPAIAVGFVLLFIGRPAAVFASTVWFRVSWAEQAFLSWAGLRGAVPIVVATIPVVEGVPDNERIFNLVFIVAVLYTLLQGPTLPLFARTMKVISEAEPRDLDLEAAPLERLGADVLQVRVPAESRMHGVEIFELRLPQGASVALIVRDGKSLVPGETTRVQRGDELLVVVPSAIRRVTEARLRAVSEHGRLAGWVDRNRR